MLMEYDQTVWGPHFWFFIHTVGFTYPELPTEGEKKRVYNFITSLEYFIPHKAISENFSQLLDEYPLSSYLSSKESLLKWIHFIHNKINVRIGKQEIPYVEFINDYNNLYKPKSILYQNQIKSKERYLYLTAVILLIGFIVYKK